jgi:nitroreductase
MNNFSELITNRRSMRKFTDEELSQEEVVSLMKAALMSPTSKRSNAWRFIVVDDKETLRKLSCCKEHGAAFLAGAALAIVVIADPLASNVWIEDASVASIMIQLQAEDLGLGSCWVQVR